MTTARMLARSGTKRGLAGGKGALRRCACGECDMTPPRKVQRTREKRQWRREASA